MTGSYIWVGLRGTGGVTKDIFFFFGNWGNLCENYTFYDVTKSLLILLHVEIMCGYVGKCPS